MYIGTQNSRIEINLGVIRNLLDDIAVLIESCETLRVNSVMNIRKEISRDFSYIVSRTHHEGLAFLTTNLPRLGKWYDDILAGRQGQEIEGFKPFVSRNQLCSFSGTSIGYACPIFLRTLWYVIHDEAGSASERAIVIRAYRSLLYLFYKLELPFTQEQLDAGLEKWKAIEFELENLSLPDYYDSDVIKIRDTIANLLSRWDRDSKEFVPHEEIFTRITPRHGPGAVAGGESNEAKWKNFHMIRSLHNVYPWYDILGVRSSCRMSPSMVDMIITFCKGRSDKEAISRLLFVPKDSRGPRVISCEPKELMFIQQGIARNLMKVLETNSHGRINFFDQAINSGLALASSETGAFATVDLEDASDRVSWTFVRVVFPDWTHKYLRATRSHSTLLPDGSVHQGHAKYAPMGSALCFPIESVVFWALGVVASIKAGAPPEEAKAATYVFGDDVVIVPAAVPHFVELCSRVGLRVNARKTFASGPFRESCGCDAWKGFDITALKIKKDICRRSLDGALATACCDYSSQCFALNYRKTGEYLYQLVNEQYPGVIRTYRSKIGCLHVVDDRPELSEKQSLITGFSPRLQKRWIVGWVVKTLDKPSDLTGFSRLLKNLFGDWEFYDPSQVVVPRATKIRKRRILVEGWPF